MEIERLKNLINHLKTVDNKLFSTYIIRTIKEQKQHPQTGLNDLIGHAINIDSSENVDNYRCYNKNIRFLNWASDYFGIEKFSNEWQYIFSIAWFWREETNNLEHAITRIQQLIDGYKPNDVTDEVKKYTFK